MRPPLYPLFLAANLFFFGNWFPVAVRFLQFLIGLLTVFVCRRAARKLWNEDQSPVTLAAAMAFPTLIFFTGELLTECLAALITSLFLLLILGADIAEQRSAVFVGLLIGIGTLTRFNLAVLGIVFSLILLRRVGIKRSILPTTVAATISILIVSPWLVRNLVTFHGSVLLSSQTGYNLVQGILTPDGRTQTGETNKLNNSEGWVVQELEVNSPMRLKLPDEGTLNRRATSHVLSLWYQNRQEAFVLLLQKIGYFWLSTDQAFETRSFSARSRVIRLCGTAFYWLVLLLVIVGFFRLRGSQPEIAASILIFAATVTLFHLPFVMNTRLATPFIAPLVCVLCSGAFKPSWLYEARQGGMTKK